MFVCACLIGLAGPTPGQQLSTEGLAPGIIWEVDPLRARRIAMEQELPILACSEKLGSRDYEWWRSSVLAHPEFESIREHFVWLYVGPDASASWHQNIKTSPQRRFKLRFGHTYGSVFWLIDPFAFDQANQLANRGVDVFSTWANAAEIKLAKRAAVSQSDYEDADKLAAALATRWQHRSDEARLKLLDHDDPVVRFHALELLAQDEKLASLRKRLRPYLQSAFDPERELIYYWLARSETVPKAGLEDFLYERIKRTSEEDTVQRERRFTAALVGKYGDGRSIPRLVDMARDRTGLYGHAPTAVTSLVELARREKSWKKKISVELRTCFPEPGLDPKYLLGSSERGIEIETGKRFRLAKQVHEALEELTGKSESFPNVYDEEGYAQLLRTWKRG